MAVSEAALEEEAKSLRQFIDDQVTGDESLISTPLLMHLVTLISGKELGEGKVRTLSDLYDRVVHRFFEPDFRRTLTGEVPRFFADGAPAARRAISSPPCAGSPWRSWPAARATRA